MSDSNSNQSAKGYTTATSWLGAAFEILTDNRKFGKFFLGLFLLFPFVASIYTEVKDAGVVPSLAKSSYETVINNEQLLKHHSEIMHIQGEQGLRLKLADCVNNAVAVAGDKTDLRRHGVALCVASLEQSSNEMFRMIKEILR